MTEVACAEASPTSVTATVMVAVKMMSRPRLIGTWAPTIPPSPRATSEGVVGDSASPAVKPPSPPEVGAEVGSGLRRLPSSSSVMAALSAPLQAAARIPRTSSPASSRIIRFGFMRVLRNIELRGLGGHWSSDVAKHADGSAASA